MPRMRDRILHPEFFTDAKLYDAEQESGLPLRLAYEGLWCAADREGRFEWKPRELKLTILPYDPVDFAAVLQALVDGGFVHRYCVDDVEIGVVRKFTKWQHVHPKEARTKLPEPPPLKIEVNGVPCNSIKSRVISPDSTSTSTSTFNSTSPQQKIPPNGGSSESSEPEQVGLSNGRASRKRGVPTWLSPYAMLWTAGDPPFGQLAKYLHPLHEKHGETETLRRWHNYLQSTEITFWSASRFKSTWDAWDKAPKDDEIPDWITDEPNFEYAD